MHRPLGRNLGIHNLISTLFSTKIAIRGFSLATQFVGSWLSGCLLTTLRCILLVKGRRGLQSDDRRIRTAGALECISPGHFEVTSISD